MVLTSDRTIRARSSNRNVVVSTPRRFSSKLRTEQQSRLGSATSAAFAGDQFMRCRCLSCTS